MTEKKKTIQINPLDITESLGYTTYRRDSRKPWTKEEDMLLTALINEKLSKLGYPEGIKSLDASSWVDHSTRLPNQIDWDQISEQLKTRKPKDCRKRWTNSLDPTLKKGKWTPEEDQLLLASYEKLGPSWQTISLEIPGRTDDQCAKRYIEVLDPNTKDRLRPWTLQEDLSLIKKVKTYGTKWRTISVEMESRPSLTCRNRWRKIVTDVVRGKADPDIKKEIDSIQGGLSKIAEISENLQSSRKKTKKEAQNDKNGLDEGGEADGSDDQTKNNENKPPQQISVSTAAQLRQHQSHAAMDARPQQINMDFNTAQQRRTGKATQNNSLMGSMTQMQNFGLSSSAESAKPATTDVDWKYTLKDRSGLSISSGAISSTDLARQLIETAKQNDLKISIHQHIHHHYASTTNGKGQSPEDSASNLSGHQNDELLPNRYTHFNYLPAMVQPQLGSSSLETTKESDLTRLLNPNTGGSHAHYQQQQQQGQSSQQQQQQQSTAHKRRTSGSSNNSRKKRMSTHQDVFGHEELDDELDFWETMRSLSQVVNINSSMSNNKVEYHDQRSKPHATGGMVNRRNSGNKGNVARNQMGLYYHALGEEEHDVEDLEDDIKNLHGLLPFNPS